MRSVRDAMNENRSILEDFVQNPVLATPGRVQTGEIIAQGFPDATRVVSQRTVEESGDRCHVARGESVEITYSTASELDAVTHLLRR